jgi:hypothetical protein
MEPTPHRPVIAVDWPESHPKAIAFTQSAVLACTDNTWLPNPNAVLALVVTALAVVVPSQTSAGTKAKGTAQTRNAAVLKLKAAVEGLAHQVQGIADANPSDAVAIIESCGFKVKTVTKPKKSATKAKPLTPAGSALLTVLAVAHAIAYFWQMSTDKTNWSDITPTKGSKTTVTGLAAGTTYYFRFRVLLKGGYGDWSQPFNVHLD